MDHFNKYKTGDLVTISTEVPNNIRYKVIGDMKRYLGKSFKIKNWAAIFSEECGGTAYTLDIPDDDGYLWHEVMLSPAQQAEPFNLDEIL